MALASHLPRKARRLAHRADRFDPPTYSCVRRPPKPLSRLEADLTQLAHLPEVTLHAAQRSAQRHFSTRALQMALLYGEVLHRAGAVIYFLRHKDIFSDDVARDYGERLAGATVVLDPSEHRVLTVYRNPRGLRRLKRKPRRDMHRSGQVR